MKRKPTFSPSIGSISSRNPEEDPIGDLAHALRLLLRQCRVERETRKAHVSLTYDWPPTTEYCDALIKALAHYAPPYTTFGERENDRGEIEWGFWPDMDAEVARLDAAGEYREMWGVADLFLVSDHGNVECGRFDKRGRWHEYWSCV